MNFPDVCCIIPCLNEEETIDEVIFNFRKILPGATIVVVDNGSTDGTARIAKVHADYLLLEPKKGKGNALLTGFRFNQKRILVLVDGDNTYSLDDVPKMVEIVRGGADMAVGVRKHHESNAYRSAHLFGNRFFSGAQRVLLGSKVEDALSGLRVCSREFIDSFTTESQGFEIETQLNVHSAMSNSNVINIPVQYFSRPSNSSSKLRTFRDGLVILAATVRLVSRWRPKIFYGIGSLCQLLFGTLLFIVPFREYLETGRILHIPTLITAMTLFILAFITLVYAVIAERLIGIARESLQRDLRYQSRLTSILETGISIPSDQPHKTV